MIDKEQFKEDYKNLSINEITEKYQISKTGVRNLRIRLGIKSNKNPNISENKNLIEEWDYKKNIINPEIVSYCSHKRVYWICKNCGNSWNAIISERAKGKNNCPNCSGFKPKGYWNDWNNLEKELKQTFPDLLSKGMFPTLEMIKNKINRGCSRVVANFGGIRKVAEKMGCKYNCLQTSDGHYVDSGSEYIVDEYLASRGIPHEVNIRISSNHNYRCDFKIGDYYIEIWGYDKKSQTSRSIQYNKKRIKKENLYKKLNLKLLSIEGSIFREKFNIIEKTLDEIFSSIQLDISLKDQNYTIENSINCCYFWSKEKVIEESKKFVEKHGEIKFHTNKIIEIKSELFYAIKEKFNNLNEVREILRIPIKRKANFYWNDEKIKLEIENIQSMLGHFPTHSDLLNLNRKDLIKAIYKNSNISEYKKIFNIKEGRVENGLYSEEFILNELKLIFNEIKHFPSWKELELINPKLAFAITNGMNKNKWSGIIYFRNIIESISNNDISKMRDKFDLDYLKYLASLIVNKKDVKELIIPKIKYKITFIKENWQMFIKQSGRCPLSNIPLNFKLENFIVENDRLIHKDIAKIKMNLEDDYFIYLCKAISNNAKDFNLLDESSWYQQFDGLNKVRQNSRVGKQGYKGVSKNGKLLRCSITTNNKRINLGYFNDEIEAAHNYDYHSINLFGKAVLLNFPDFDYSNFIPKKSTEELIKTYGNPDT